MGSPCLKAWVGVVLFLTSSCTASSSTPGERREWVKVSAWISHACALTDHHEFACWGIPQATSFRDDQPDEVPMVDISAGHWQTCAAGVDGELYCWGTPPETNDAGLLDPTPRYNDPVVAVDVSIGWACALEDDGDVRCWGGPNQRSRDYGQLEDVDRGPATTFEIGFPGGLWLDDAGVVQVWGYKTEPSRRHLIFRKRPEQAGFVDVYVEGDLACAVDAQHKPTCWGDDFDDQLDDIPDEVRDIGLSGFGWTCAVELDGQMSCWGKNGGYPEPEEPVFDLSVSTGGYCAILDDRRTIVCENSGGVWEDPPDISQFEFD